MNCSFCQDSEKYESYLVKKFGKWRIELWSNQCYLGRCIVVLNRHVEDLFEVSESERQELFEIVPQLKAALSKLFKPDHFNYESLGNETRHLHLRVTPRYKSSVEFEGTIFVDERWGKNPSPYNKEFKVSDRIIEQLVAKIGDALQ